MSLQNKNEYAPNSYIQSPGSETTSTFFRSRESNLYFLLINLLLFHHATEVVNIFLSVKLLTEWLMSCVLTHHSE